MTEKLKYEVGDKVLVEAEIEEADCYDSYPYRLRVGNTTTGEVEKEKMYLVTLKSTGQLLARTADGFFFGTNDPYFKDSQYEFTKQELIEAGFEGVFDNPMFEVEEVE